MDSASKEQPVNLGETARNLRESLALTAEAAAERLGITDVQLRDIEDSKTPLAEDLLKKYREVFCVDLHVYAWCSKGGAGDVPPSNRDSTRHLASQWQNLIDGRVKEYKDSRQSRRERGGDEPPPSLS